MQALTIIRHEHRNMTRVAQALRGLGDRLGNSPSDLDFRKIEYIIDYFEGFTERYHHPKENNFLFARLLQRAGAARPLVERLMRDHEKAPVHLVRMREALTAADIDDATRRARLSEIIAAFHGMIGAHMHSEESELFELARTHLTEDDWREIDAAFASHIDPLDSTEGEGDIALLRQRIMALLPPLDTARPPAGDAAVGAAPAAMMLEVRDLKTRYGRIEALHGVSIAVAEGQLVALVGANGAGKTTLLRCISGVQPASGGDILLRGQSIAARRSHHRVRAGICQVPEGRQVFGPMSIEDNLRMGAFTRRSAGIEDDLEKVYAMFPILKERRTHPAGTLSGGQQQMLALGRALMGRPRILLLDEPSMGLAPVIVEEIFRTIRALKEDGITILLVEQNARAALSIADHAYVLETGYVTLEGPGKELLANDEVRRAYLGM
ncbi:MAG: ATP-binding cassette domain-containing protein [Xanthobacteraceae bacterium]|nr:MAG: ATP-binding cassette domain-containing protein [Xanthobacteraceae bacterium]